MKRGYHGTALAGITGLVTAILVGGCGDASGEAEVSVPSERPVAERGDAERPNVLFIVIDDLAVAFGAYGHPTARTPNIDALASQGMRFDRAYVQNPVCNPSRSSFLSGFRSSTTEVYGNATHPRAAVGDALMLPEYFAAHGYFTARVGKVSHGRYADSITWDVSEDTVWREHYLPGVDHSEVKDNLWFEGADRGLSRAQILAHVGRPVGLPLTWRATDEREQDTPDGRTAERVMALLRAHEGRAPFFIAAGFHKPHQPWVAPKRFFDQHPVAAVALPSAPANDRDDIPLGAVVGSGYPEDADHTDAQKRQAIAAYHATVSLVDSQVGKLLRTLDELGLRDSTVVVLFSDHGFHLGEHLGLWRKQSQFEESTRIPLIVRAPGVRPGQSTMALVEAVDLYPTLVDLAGLPPKDDLEGSSFRALLADSERQWKKAVFSESRRRGFYGRSIRTEGHRYTEWRPVEDPRSIDIGDPEALRTGADVDRELYDVETDPGEFVNLALDDAHADLVDALAARLEAGWRAALPDAN